MPVYEYRCGTCRKVTSVFVRVMKDPENLACEHCGSADLHRMVSKVAYHPTMQRVWEISGPPSANPSDDYYKDPRNIGRWTEQRLQELGVEMPSEARKMIDAAREGTMPEPLNDL